MAIVTLTTDFGTRDPYAASLKGALYSLCPGLTLVDVSHEISPFDTLEASFVLGSAYAKFPMGTIHLVGVDPEGSNRTQAVAMELDGHLFLAPDNGVLPMISDEKEARFVLISPELVPYPDEGRAFQALKRLTKAVQILQERKDIRDLGEPFEPKSFILGLPAQTHQAIRGQIIHLDRFGNAITNIKKSVFFASKGDRAFEIIIRKNRIKRIVTSYADTSKGEIFAIFSETGHLEIGLREDNCSKLLGVNRHDNVTIEFIE